VRYPFGEGRVPHHSFVRRVRSQHPDSEAGSGHGAAGVQRSGEPDARVRQSPGLAPLRGCPGQAASRSDGLPVRRPPGQTASRSDDLQV